MKKKAIEKIPFLKLSGVSRKKMVKYVAVTDVKKIGEEPHLFVEVYRNRKECREVPIVRIAVTKKDFATYFPEFGTWSRGRISSYNLIWQEDDERIGKSENVMAEENILRSMEDLERIRKFMKDIMVRNPDKWWEYIDRRQEDIIKTETAKKAERKWERRKQALKERQEQTPELPEQKILEYADDILFHNRHYLYYRKRGARATVACSKCGGVMEARWKPGISYESQFQRYIEEPKQGLYGTCPLCQTSGVYMPQGRAKSFYREARYLFLGQKYKEQGMVFRYIEVEKEWQLEQTCGEKEIEMCGSYEKLTGIEVARAYFEPGKKLQMDYHKHNPWKGKDFWDDCNLSGLASIRVNNARTMPETYGNMKGTFLQYSALEEYQKAAGEDVNPVDYLERYIQMPQIEILVKMGLTGVVRELVKCHYGIVKDIDAKRADLFFGIRKERVKQLIKHRGDGDILRMMQLEKRLEQNWTDEQIEQLAELGMGYYEVNTALEYMGIQKLLNRVAMYAGCEYGTMCSTASARLKNTAQTYIDYLNMRKAAGYDLQNTVYLFPKNLQVAHNMMVLEWNKKETDKRIRLVNEKYALIKKHYRKLRKKFCYEDKDFLIRPARDAGEIVMEGRMLHHCVGGDYYLDKHNRDESIILFLRLKAEPDIPYITVEIETESLNIRQWYGAHDEKPDKDRMQKWLDIYVARLKGERLAIESRVKEEVTEQRLMAAV